MVGVSDEAIIDHENEFNYVSRSIYLILFGDLTAFALASINHYWHQIEKNDEPFLNICLMKIPIGMDENVLSVS